MQSKPLSTRIVAYQIDARLDPARKTIDATEALTYRIVFTGAAVKNWAIQATVEYADPRDTALEQEFLSAVYADALKNITQ